ncbi:FHA domain-containing protein [Zavarzinella formosa]|uniref:FHA domain-containing protein n=1 Tax=Zavarzinella formosa TaxID=360055 RepID=UPI00030D2B7A|nr:FHA domain-containing protein [Zavarzinella formosa]
MKCPSCGYENEDGALFCEHCKADLDMPSATPPNKPIPMNEEDTAEQTPVPITLSEVLTPSGIPITLEPVTPEVAAPPTIGIYQPDEAITTKDYNSPPTIMPVAEPPPALGNKPRLVVLRGMKIDMQYPLYPGKNYLGRTDDKPVDIDLDDQEAPDRIWCSRQHAVISFENGQLTIEDLNSLNGSFVNRARVYPGQSKELRENDVIQIGTVHMKLLLG